MLITFGEMLSSLYSDLKYGATPDADVTTRLKRLLNEAHRTILRTRKMSEERGLELTFDTSAGQRYYGIPQAFDSINDIRQIDESICLVMRTREWVVHQDPQENTIGTPYVWIPNGMQPVARQPSIQGSGLWAFSTSPADTTQTVRVMAVRAKAGLTTEQTATLNGTTPVRVGALSDIAGVLQFTLSAKCAGDVSLIDAPDLPLAFTAGAPVLPADTSLPFPSQPVLDTFDRADENPLDGGGQWAHAAWYATQPLAIVNNRAVKASAASSLAASYLNTRFSTDDAEAYVTVAALPTLLPTTSEQYVSITFTPGRPDGSVLNDGYWLALVQGWNGDYRLECVRFVAGAGVELLLQVAVTFAAGDAFGIERNGEQVRVHLRNAGVWRQIGDSLAVAHRVPLYPAIIINDQSNQIALEDFGGGPYNAHVLGTIDRFAGTSQPYFSIRLWPTPQGPRPYTVKGTLRIPDMVRDQDYPIFVQPEFCDALMTYVRAREYKTVKADTERFEMEQAEWAAVMGGLNAAANFPKDYRPVAGGADRGRWSNLGGFYPADIGGGW